MDNLKAQLEQAQQAASAVLDGARTEHAAELVKLQRELSASHDDLAALKSAFEANRESIEAMSHRHSSELDETATRHTARLSEMEAQYHSARTNLENAVISGKERIHELEVELEVAKVKAADAAQPPPPPRANGAASPGVTKEELKSLHEAHNLKMHTMEAEFQKRIADLTHSLEIAVAKADELETESERKDMRLHFLEKDQDESQDRIQRYVNLWTSTAVVLGLAIFYALI